MPEESLWRTNPSQAHQDWRNGLALADRGYAKQSQRLYISLFGRFCKWMSANKCDIYTVNATQLKAFLTTLKGRDEASPAADRTKRTYVAEIDRVIGHLQAQNWRRDNPAAAMMDELRMTTPLLPRAIYLPSKDVRARYIESLSKQASPATPESLQRAAMNLLMLDCGLTLKELQKLRMKHVNDLATGIVTAPGHRVLAERPIKMTSESLHWMRAWLEARNRLTVQSYRHTAAKRVVHLNFEGKSNESASKSDVANSSVQARDKVFVSFLGRSDQPQALRGLGLAIDKLPDSTIYLSAQDVLVGVQADKEIALAEHNKGPQTLRNMCCANLVGSGIPASQAAKILGLSKPDQVWAMARHLKTKHQAAQTG